MHFFSIWKALKNKSFMLIICISITTACRNDKGEALFLDFKSYTNPNMVLWCYKNATLANSEDGFSLITIYPYQVDSFEIELTLIYYDDKLGAVLADVDNEDADRFELKYAITSTMNVKYERNIGPCTKSTDIYSAARTACFKWFDLRIVRNLY